MVIPGRIAIPGTAPKKRIVIAAILDNRSGSDGILNIDTDNLPIAIVIEIQRAAYGLPVDNDAAFGDSLNRDGIAARAIQSRGRSDDRIRPGVYPRL